MKLRPMQSISGKLTALILVVSGTALLFAYISFLAYDYYSLRNNLIESLQTEAAMVSTSSESALLFDDQQAAAATLRALRGAPSVLAAEVFRPDGKPFARYTSAASANESIVPKLPPGTLTASWIENGRVLLGRTIVSGGKPIGSVYILAETSEVIYRARRFGMISAVILLICFGFALLAASAMRGFLIRPLENLAETARIVSREKDYSVRAKVPRRRDELAFLVESFNEMLDEIQQSRAVLEQKVVERTAELSSANRELEAFSYTVAHDLRGPLQQITNIAFLIGTLEGSGNADERKVWLDKLSLAAVGMSSLIDDLLNLSRAASASIEHGLVDLGALAKSILDNLAQGGERRVETIVAPDCVASADKGLIKVVLENLLRNAWKYSSRKECARIEFGCRTENDETVFFVKDNGAGFDPAFADRLFRPFQRLHSQADFPGTGVGLATVQRIIARHGGRVWASGSVDHGAEFSFTLPVHPAHKPPG